MERKKMICIACPLGCHIEVFRNHSEDGFSVTGNQCKRGIDYGVKEMINPTRLLTTTVKLRNSYLNRLPVRTDLPIPKAMIANCMREINRIEVCAPVKAGIVLIRNILNTGVNVISSRSIGTNS
jgi:CxxC motif-containing protein